MSRYFVRILRVGRATVMHGALVLLVAVAAACAPAAPPPVAPTVTAEGPTETPLPSATPTETATPAPTATPRLPVAVGTGLPAPAATMSVGNVNQIVELARWGRGVIDGLSYSPDGKTIALASASGAVVIAADTLEEVKSIESDAPAYSIAFSSDGTMLAAGLEDGTVAVWDAKSGQRKQKLSGPTEPINSVAFSPDGSLLAGGSEDGSVTLWQVTDGAVQQTYSSHSKPITAVVFAPDGNSLFTGSMDASIHQLQLPDGKVLRVFGGYASAGITLSADGAVLAAAGGEDFWSNKQQIRVWNVADGKALRTIEGEALSSVALSPDGKLVATAGQERSVNVWNVASGENEATFDDLKPKEEAPPGWFHLAFSPAGDELAAGGLEVLGVWDVQEHKFLRSAKTHSFPIYGIAVSPDGKLLASVGYVDVQLRSLVNGETIPLPSDVTGFTDVAFSPDGKALVLGAQDGKARIWPLDDLAHPQVFDTLNGGKVRGIAISPDGNSLAFSAERAVLRNFWTGYTGEIELHNVADGAIRKTLTGSALWYVSDLAYSPAGDMLASVSPGDRIMVFRTKDDARLYTFQNGLGLAFSPDGSRLAGSLTDKRVHIWSLDNGKNVLTTQPLPEMVWPVAFSPDGKLLVGGDENGTVYIWNAANASLVKSWPAHSSYVNDLAFTPDGSMLITASGDGTIRFWGLRP